MRGKAWCADLTAGFPRDHPRVCGEKAQRARGLNLILGSSPRMRGKVNAATLNELSTGIIPAYAGKRFCYSFHEVIIEDHPRVCGEKSVEARSVNGLAGSSPRMRGKVFDIETLAKTYGIIPAYAGKRLKRSRSTVPPVAIVPLFPSVCNKPVVSDGSPAGRDAPLFLPAENAVPASPACNLRSL